jgi:hypothetical protein
MADNFDVFLRFLLDDDAASKAKADAKSTLDGVTKASDESAKKVNKNLERIADQAAKTAIIVGTVGEALEGISKRGLLLSGAFFTGVFAFANKYVKDAKEATATTAEWTRQTERLQASSDKVGATLAQEALPLLRVAANLAEKASDFVEKNPDIIRAALNTGVVVAGLSAVGLAVSKGIRFVADISMITATATQLLASKNMQDAANKQLAASAGSVSSGGATAALAGAGKFAAVTAIPLAVGGVIGKEFVNSVERAIGKEETTWNNLGQTVLQLVQAPTKIALLGLREVGVISPETAKKVNSFQNALFGLGGTLKDLVDEAGESTAKIQAAVTGLRGSANEQSIVQAFTTMKNSELNAERTFQDQRRQIISQSNSSILAAYRNNASAVQRINEQAEKQRASIIESFAKESAQATQRYESDRARILRDSGLEIQNIESERLENLRKLQEEHDIRVQDLAADRDALGLVLEQRAFDREKAEIDREANQEIAQRRRDLAIRLQDLAQNYAMERAQRQAEFQEKLKANEEQRIQQLKQQQEQHAAELKQIREQRAERLRELAIQHNEERRRIRENFIAQVRDLDASLLGEQNTKRRYYAAMLTDAEAFLASYRKLLPGGLGSGVIPQYDTGGYTPSGIIKTHHGEFITTPGTTGALEQLIGGRLNQQNLIAAVAGGGSNVQWNDQRRFSGEYTKSMKRQVERDTLATIEKVFKK